MGPYFGPMRALEKGLTFDILSRFLQHSQSVQPDGGDAVSPVPESSGAA